MFAHAHVQTVAALSQADYSIPGTAQSYPILPKMPPTLAVTLPPNKRLRYPTYTLIISTPQFIQFPLSSDEPMEQVRWQDVREWTYCLITIHVFTIDLTMVRWSPFHNSSLGAVVSTSLCAPSRFRNMDIRMGCLG